MSLTFISSFPQLLVVHSLLNQIEYFGREGRISQRISFRVNFFCLKSLLSLRQLSNNYFTLS